MPTTSPARLALLVAAALALPGVASAAKPKPYPTVSCVSAKQKAAAQFCRAAFAAEGQWARTQDDGRRLAALERATAALDGAWRRAEQRSTAKGADCTDTTVSATQAVSRISSAAGAFVAQVADGLDGKCGAKLAKAAAGRCAAMLLADSRFVLGPGKKPADAARARRTRSRERAAAAFVRAYGKASGGSCATGTTTEQAGALVDALVDAVVYDTTASPRVSSASFDTLAPVGPIAYAGRQLTPVCMDGSPYRFFAKRGTVNRVLFYFQGGGACWESLTCAAPVCDANVVDGDNPGTSPGGFFDLSNPANPFRDWHIVFVSYCSCDIHFGDAAQDYPPHVEHRGYQNSRVVEKWAREHFVAPEAVFVTGSSAGAYGAWFNAPLLIEVWPGARFDVLADAGNGVITQAFLDAYFPNWNFEANLPPEIPELRQVLEEGSGIPGYTRVIAERYPEANWAHYTAAFDGGIGSQSSFYNIMLNDNQVLSGAFWWEASCAFNAQMRSQAIATAADLPANYRYYIGTSSRHTIWFSNKVYTDTRGGVPALVEWLNAMMANRPGAGAPGWTNVECTDCGVVIPGEPVPNPLVAPFTQVGPDVVIQCPAP